MPLDIRNGRPLPNGESAAFRPRINPLLLRWRTDREFNKKDLEGFELAEFDGDCLRPWFLPGDYLVFARNMEPHSGDVVLAEVTLLAASRGLTFGIPTRPKEVVRRAAKQFIVEGSAAWFAAVDGRAPAEAPHRIIGTLVMWHRRPFFTLRRWRYPLRSMNFAFNDSPSS